MERTNENPVARDDRVEGDQSRKNPPLNSEPRAPRQAASAWKRAATDTLLVLQARFPQCVARLHLSRRQPLKLGVHLDVIAALPELPVADIRRALKFYVGDIRYLQSCTEGKHRIDLDGKPAGIVTAEEAAHCKNSLDGILAKRQRRKPQSRPGSPPPAAPSKKLSLADLKAAAVRKRVSVAEGAP
jgi:ProP effector